MSADIARICLLCFSVSGIIAARTSTVNAMMLSPKLPKNTTYNSTRLLIIGSTMMRFQTPATSKGMSYGRPPAAAARFLRKPARPSFRLPVRKPSRSSVT